jgi:hypothetical protein
VAVASASGVSTPKGPMASKSCMASSSSRRRSNPVNCASPNRST